MTTNRRKSNLTLIQKILVFTMVLEAQFFYIIPLPNIFWLGNNSDNKSYIIIILYFTIFLMFLQNNLKIKKTRYYSFAVPYFAVQLLISAILIVRSKYLYSQSWFSMTQCADYLFMPFTAVAFMAAFEEETDFNKMMKALVLIVFLCQAAIFINGVGVKALGVTLFKGMSQGGSVNVRSGMVRSARNALNFIGIGFSFNCLINKNYDYLSKDANLIMFILSLINALLFNGYRTIIAATVSMIFVIFICSSRIRRSTKIFFAILAVIALFGFGMLESFMESFSTEGDLSGSTLTRMNSYEFHWNRFKDNPLFGFGLIRPYTARTWLLFGGKNGLAITDAGIIGLLAETGLLGALTYAVLYIRGVYIALKVKGDFNRPFLFGILAYIAVSCPSIIITNISRCMAIPVCMAIFESVYYRYKARG